MVATALAVDAEPEAVSLSLLHGFELRCGGLPVAVPRGSQRVLAFLALHDRPVQRSYVAGNLWAESSEERAAANLRSALWRLNRGSRPLVEVVGTQLHVTPGLQIDIREAIAQARGLLSGGPMPIEVSFHEIPWDCDLLPDWYDDWVLVERERYRQLRLHALEALCEGLTQGRRFAAAVEAGVTAVGAEPLRESARRALISAHIAEGNLGEALRQYRDYVGLLRTELGVAPSAELQELIRRSIGMTA
jgi:DNA-binding SARP family transcriptional activator